MNLVEIQEIVGMKHLVEWQRLKPTVYYKQGKPYGLIAVLYELGGVSYIASTTANPDLPFTKNMIRDIIRLYKQDSICLITDYVPAQEKIRSSLTRYGFIYKDIGGVLYSYHFKEKD